MIIGVNSIFPHEGTDYHIQVEDLDPSGELEVRVYVGGGIVFHKRHPYLQIVEGKSQAGRVEAITEEMNRLVSLVRAAIQKGRIGPGGTA
jgi:hypothetical protein